MICKAIEREKKPNFLFFLQPQRNKPFNERRPLCCSIFTPHFFPLYIHDDARLRAAYVCER